MLDRPRYAAAMPTVGIVLFILLVVVLFALPIVLRRYLGDLRTARRVGREIWMGVSNPSGGSYVPHDDLGPSPRDRLRAPPDDDH
jgi:hypothetical protein